MIDDACLTDYSDKLRALLDVRLPEVEPDLQVEAETACDGHRRLRLTYLVEPGERIPAYLLIPDGLAGPAPAILAIHQHGGKHYLGKSEPAGLSRDPMYHYGLDMVRRGYVVMIPDQLAFEERTPPEFLRREGLAPDDNWNERYEFGKYLLRGSTLQAKYLADLYRAVDLLLARPEVDADRVGVLGHSLGGQETLWYTWFDPRVKVAFSSCGFALYQAILDAHIIHNFAFYVPGLLNLGDIDLLVAALAPRPFFFSAGTQDDIFPVASVQRIYERAREVYARHGAEDRVVCRIFDGGHGLPDEVKAEAYAFLDSHLKV